MHILGLDIGGSGIKGALVDSESGALLTARHRIVTPQPATPEAVADVTAQIVTHFAWQGPLGCGFPAVVKAGVTCTAANVSPRWLGAHAQQMLEHATGCPTLILNDADAAGLAEMRFGAGRERQGLVLIITLGTGIGTALFVDGHLVPNTELGHIEIRGKEAEKRASDGVRRRKKLNWQAWAVRVDEYLRRMEQLFWPDLIIIGGGVSKSAEKFLPLLTVHTEIVPAQLRNDAGIIGAAFAAAQHFHHQPEFSAAPSGAGAANGT